MRLVFLGLLLLVLLGGQRAQTQPILLPCVPSGISCIPVSATNPLPTTPLAVAGTVGDFIVVGPGTTQVQDASRTVSAATSSGNNLTMSASGVPGAVQGNLDAGWNYNTFTCTDTGIDVSGLAAGSQTANCLNVFVISNGSKAIDQAIFGTLNVTGVPGSVSNTLNQFIAGQFIGQASANLGGTNTGAGAVGAIFGMGASAVAGAAATNLLNVSNELNGAIVTGGSSKSFSLLSLAALANHAVAGVTYDAGLSISSISGAIGLTNGILLSDYNGQQPIASGGCIMCTQGSSTITTGIDASSYTISGNFLKGPSGFSVLGNARTIISTASNPQLIVQSTGTNVGQININNAAGGQISTLHFQDAGTDKWIIQKGAGNGFILFDSTTGLNSMTISTAGVIALGEANPLSISATGAITATLSNVATTSAVCYNTSTGAITYDGTIGTCTVSALWRKNLIGVLSEADLGVLRPIVYTYQENDKGVGDDRVHVGLAADDVAMLDERCVAYDAQGRLSNYEDRCILAYLVQANKQLKKEIEALKSR